MIALLLAAALVFVTTPAWADGPVVAQSACTYSWDAPQLNTDNTPLTDLKDYRIYAAPTLAALAALTTPTAVVPALELDPPAGKTGSWSCKGLALGQHYVTSTAVDTTGNQSARAPIVPFVLADDVSPQAPQNPRVGP